MLKNGILTATLMGVALLCSGQSAQAAYSDDYPAYQNLSSAMAYAAAAYNSSGSYEAYDAYIYFYYAQVFAYYAFVYQDTTYAFYAYTYAFYGLSYAYYDWYDNYFLYAANGTAGYPITAYFTGAIGSYFAYLAYSTGV